MVLKKHVFCVDSHTAGEPTRVVISGFVWKKCDTMAEKMAYFKEKYDHVRKAVVLEPRGYIEIVGAVLSEPCDPRADVGVFYIESGGCLNMCGHGTIGTVTTLVEMGMIESRPGETVTVKLDTPAGLITTYAAVSPDGDKVDSVSFDNVPSFVYKADQHVYLDGFGDVKFDLCFGGSFFAAIPIDQFDMELLPANSVRLTEMGMRIRRIINDTIPVQHPLRPSIKTVDLCNFYRLDLEHGKFHTIVIFGDGQVDRSPCGTGTSAMSALLYTRGLLKVGDEIIAQSVLGTQFRGKVLEAVDEAGYQAIIPRITGTAFLVGTNQLLIDERDPFREGFILNQHK